MLRAVLYWYKCNGYIGCEIVIATEVGSLFSNMKYFNDNSYPSHKFCSVNHAQVLCYNFIFAHKASMQCKMTCFFFITILRIGLYECFYCL